MKKTYITPAIETVSAHPATILAGSGSGETTYDPSINKWDLGTKEDEDKARWQLSGEIIEYTGDGSDIVISTKGDYDPWNGWED